MAENPVLLETEQDELGAAMLHSQKPLIIKNDKVTIYSKFPLHAHHLGEYGVHFVGLNAKQIPWEFEGRPAMGRIALHWGKIARRSPGESRCFTSRQELKN